MVFCFFWGLNNKCFKYLFTAYPPPIAQITGVAQTVPVKRPTITPAAAPTRAPAAVPATNAMVFKNDFGFSASVDFILFASVMHLSLYAFNRFKSCWIIAS